MKPIALFGVLAVLTEAAIVARQEHGHSEGTMAPMPVAKV
jgi:hypothetical protein